MERTCLHCQQKIIGRIDKKFCTDSCRNDYNNQKNKASSAYVRKVTDILRKNRRILKKLNPNGKVRVKAQTLYNEGFNFHYHTHFFKTKTNRTYFFCYEYGYFHEAEKEEYLLVIQQDYMIRNAL